MIMCISISGDINRHIKTHSERSNDDRNAINTIKYFFKTDGKIVPEFKEDDKWPNIDGRFELVSEPEVSRQPLQNFFVQIKGTSNYHENNGIVKYQLKNLAFPAFVYNHISSDPCILFVVLNPTQRGKERLFWKYISPSFLMGIDFSRDSMTISFSPDEELFNNDESIDNFVDKLVDISEKHTFSLQLSHRKYTKDDILKCIKEYSSKICDAIKNGNLLEENREQISKKILRELNYLCESAILLNGFIKNGGELSLKDAWDYCTLSIDTKFLATFLQGLKYIGLKIPEDGQNERIMLKYYDFLWQIREFVNKNYSLQILDNLEDFPISINDEEKDFNEIIAKAIDSVEVSCSWRGTRYFIKKITPFYVGKNRYFEVTLQLSSKYATKFNRLTVYTKKNISTNYSIQISYYERDIKIFNSQTKVKILTDWRVSIEPAAINKFSLLFDNEIKISSNYKEYGNLMNFLTLTGISFLNFIDMNDRYFNFCIDKIYQNCNTSYFKDVLIMLHKSFNNKSVIYGKNITRYILMSMREDILDDVIMKENERKKTNKKVKFVSKCIPFERNPIIYNLPNHKTNFNDVIRTVGHKKAHENIPYIVIKNYIDTSGEIFLPISPNDKSFLGLVKKYNDSLECWDYEKGKIIKEYKNHLYIEHYVNDTITILKQLLLYSTHGNEGQKQLNNKFLNSITDDNLDQMKMKCIKEVFVESNILLIYGAAGTGKTTLMKYISKLMAQRKKIFLSKTHTALQNLKRRINNDGYSSQFMSIDKVNRKKIDISDYDIVFIDECSIIDNRSMVELLSKISKNSLIVLAGDIYQIESIDFGNWFFYAKDIMPSKSVIELSDTWRTDNQNLKNLWDEVRYRKQLILEKLVIDGPYSENIGNSLFFRNDHDEVVLCLNYDGKYGLNSINNYFQDINTKNKSFEWDEWKYKVGDPILFNESKRFPILYNNLKGKIVDIYKGDGYINFIVEVELCLTNLDTKNNDFTIFDYNENSTLISFYVEEDKGGITEEEREKSKMRSIVPFQLAYAVSIHKAQGLEYNCVKIVIPNSNSEIISHGIFYTAITRAKEKLKIYWSADTMNKVVKNFENEKLLAHSLAFIKELMKN